MKRYYEIDVIRGIAIVMMILFHLLWDLNYFEILSVDLYRGFWKLFQVATATLFLLIVGISTVLSLQHALTFSQKIKKTAIRSLKLLSIALLITVVTYLFMSESYIFFGILHLIAVSIFLSIFFIPFFYLNLFLGVTLIILGNLLKTMTFNFSWLAWLGFQYEGLSTLDYYPVLPWFGVVLIGIFLGKYLYSNSVNSLEERKYSWLSLIETRVKNILSYLGTYSLTIYLIHQPILFGVIYLLVNFL